VTVAAEAYACVVCGYLYDDAVGDAAHGVAPGTPWERIPESWICPECGAPKSDFERQQF
jgi:rubredoxin